MASLAERFFAKVQKGDGCWMWVGGQNRSGNGLIHRLNRMELAHRISYELHVRPIPVGMHVCHRCDNPTCVNPAHLFLGTHKDNMDDRDAKDRVRHGAAHPCAKISEGVALKIREAYAAGGRTMQSLADEHGVDRSVVSRIISGKTWARASRRAA